MSWVPCYPCPDHHLFRVPLATGCPATQKSLHGLAPFTGLPQSGMRRVLTRCMTTTRDLEQQILNLIESSIEDTRVPDAIAAHADKRAGKPVTKTDADQLEAQLGVPVRIRRQHGMTHVSWAVGAAPNPWREERSILLAHSDTNVRWPSAAELLKKEPAYFGARDERNESRKNLLAEHHQPERIPYINPSHVERAAAAIAKLREAREELLQLMDYGKPLHVVRYPVEKLCLDAARLD